MSEVRIDVYVDQSDRDEAVGEIEGHLGELGILARVEW